MNHNHKNKNTHAGPWYHRALVWLFSIIFGLLLFWLLGFIVSDLGTWPGPQLHEIEQEILDETLVNRKEELDEQIQSVKESIDAQEERQGDLRDSTDAAEKTMNRLLEIQRLALEKGKDISQEENKSLTEAKDLFLSNQKQYQLGNQRIANLKQQRRDLSKDIEDLENQLNEQRDEAQERYRERQEWHDIQMAAIKLTVLVPLLIASALAFARWRKSLYVPLIYAFGISTALKVGMVMHDHFPTRYFKYVLIIVAIVIVVGLLVRLLRHMARPDADWLLRQYREAYERFVCPICEYPIRRGPLRFHYWNRRSIKKLSLSLDSSSSSEIEAYVCPSCATSLFEKCEQCDQLRPSLMRACPHCGDERSAATILSTAEANNSEETPVDSGGKGHEES